MKKQMARVYGVEFDGKIVYVGVTKQACLARRFFAHTSAARTGASGANKLGEWLLTNPIYTIKVIEYVPIEERFKRERYWINFYKTEETGFNRPIYRGGAHNPWRGAKGRPKGCDNPSGKSHYASRRVRHTKTGKVYQCMREAAEANGLSTAAVCLHANGKRQNPLFEFIE